MSPWEREKRARKREEARRLAEQSDEEKRHKAALSVWERIQDADASAEVKLILEHIATRAGIDIYTETL